MTYILDMKIYSRGRQYKDIVIPYHPYADSMGRIALHRYVMEQKIGRYLLPTEHVHHIDKNVNNNDPSNLEILTNSQHVILHHSTGITYVSLICDICKKSFVREKRKIQKKAIHHFCSVSCNRLYFSKNPPIGGYEKKEIVHGNVSAGYRKGCRCVLCKRAKNEAIKKYRAGVRERNDINKSTHSDFIP